MTGLFSAILAIANVFFKESIDFCSFSPAFNENVKNSGTNNLYVSVPFIFSISRWPSSIKSMQLLILEKDVSSFCKISNRNFNCLVRTSFTLKRGDSIPDKTDFESFKNSSFEM